MWLGQCWQLRFVRRTVDDLDCAVVRNLADRVATGSLSITAASHIMEAIVKEDGVSKAWETP